MLLYNSKAFGFWHNTHKMDVTVLQHTCSTYKNAIQENKFQRAIKPHDEVSHGWGMGP